jgi:hypothetical protein
MRAHMVLAARDYIFTAFSRKSESCIRSARIDAIPSFCIIDYESG